MVPFKESKCYDHLFVNNISVSMLPPPMLQKDENLTTNCFPIIQIAIPRCVIMNNIFLSILDGGETLLTQQ